MRDRFLALARLAQQTIGGIDLLVMLSILTVVGGVWVFLAIADEVVEGETSRIDERILLAFRDQADPGDPIGSPEFEEFVRDLTALGSAPVIGLVTFSVVGFLLIDRKYHAGVLVLVATVGGQAISTTLKGLYDRPRPDVVPHLMHAAPGSFPSGHSMLAAVTYLTLGALIARLVTRARLKIFVVFMAVTITALVGVSRIYLGVHYPTDVLAGWTAGLVWAILCWEATRWLQRRGVVEESVES